MLISSCSIVINSRQLSLAAAPAAAGAAAAAAAAATPGRARCLLPLQRRHLETVLLLLPAAVLPYVSLPQLPLPVRPHSHARLAARAKGAPPRFNRLQRMWRGEGQ